jgi:phage-related protein
MKLRVEFAEDANGRRPAEEFIQSLPDRYRKQIERTLSKLEATGRVVSNETFKHLTDSPMWEVKAFQARVLGDFRPGGRFVVAHGTMKKQDKLPKTEIATAIRLLEIHDRKMESVTISKR